jgi:hypothetical protein
MNVTLLSACRWVGVSLLLLGSALLGRAQGYLEARTVAEAGLGVATTPHTPFWLRANQAGTVPLRLPAGYLAGGGWAEWRRDSLPGRSAWRVGAGAYAVVNTGPVQRAVVPEAYARLAYRGLELMAGLRREVIGLGDTLLTSGFLVGSGNALPIPKVLFSTPRFVPLGRPNAPVAIKAGYAHGWYDPGYLVGAQFHQKFGYLRLGRPAGRWYLTGGFNHQVLYGGYAAYLRDWPDRAVEGRLPASWRLYRNVVLGLIPDDQAAGGLTGFDATYRVGNHVGGYDLALEWRARRGTWLLYHQHVFEDVSGIVLKNARDGLTGLSWQRRPARIGARAFGVVRVVGEYLHTMHQSGAEFFQSGSAYQGKDNYFNHGQYVQGWSNFGRALGTPFLVPLPELPDLAAEGGREFFPSNRVRMGYLGLMGYYGPRLTWTVRLALSHQAGTYNSPLDPPRTQQSGLLRVAWAPRPYPRWQLSAALAADGGTFLPPTTGLRLGLRYEPPVFSVKKPKRRI